MLITYTKLWSMGWAGRTEALYRRLGLQHNADIPHRGSYSCCFAPFVSFQAAFHLKLLLLPISILEMRGPQLDHP